MSELLLQPTQVAEWYTLINEAEANCSLELGEDLESYLVFLLMRFLGKPEVVIGVMAIEFLRSVHATGQQRSEMLREVGDKCLLLSGLFPQLTKRRRVQDNYFVDLGQNAYYELAGFSTQQLADLYLLLCRRFEPMRDVLRAIRQPLGNTLPDSEQFPAATQRELTVLLKRLIH
jgi:hypothetical protein